MLEVPMMINFKVKFIAIVFCSFWWSDFSLPTTSAISCGSCVCFPFELIYGRMGIAFCGWSYHWRTWDNSCAGLYIASLVRAQRNRIHRRIVNICIRFKCRIWWFEPGSWRVMLTFKRYLSSLNSSYIFNNSYVTLKCFNWKRLKSKIPLQKFYLYSSVCGNVEMWIVWTFITKHYNILDWGSISKYRHSFAICIFINNLKLEMINSNYNH